MGNVFLENIISSAVKTVKAAWKRLLLTGLSYPFIDSIEETVRLVFRQVARFLSLWRLFFLPYQVNKSVE